MNHVCFVLDESGSMDSMRDEVISGFNKYLEDLQKDALKEPYAFTLFQFDTTAIKEVDTALDPAKVSPLTKNSYRPGAGTPLFDAVAHGIVSIAKNVKDGEKAMVVVFTDGLENSSREYTREKIQALIKSKSDAGWGFIYLGVAEAAWGQEQSFAVGSNMASNTVYSSGGAQAVVAVAAASGARTAYFAGADANTLITDADRKKVAEADEQHKTQPKKTNAWGK